MPTLEDIEKFRLQLAQQAAQNTYGIQAQPVRATSITDGLAQGLSNAINTVGQRRMQAHQAAAQQQYLNYLQQLAQQQQQAQQQQYNDGYAGAQLMYQQQGYDADTASRLARASMTNDKVFEKTMGVGPDVYLKNVDYRNEVTKPQDQNSYAANVLRQTLGTYNDKTGKWDLNPQQKNTVTARMMGVDGLPLYQLPLGDALKKQELEQGAVNIQRGKVQLVGDTYNNAATQAGIQRTQVDTQGKLIDNQYAGAIKQQGLDTGQVKLNYLPSLLNADLEGRLTKNQNALTDAQRNAAVFGYQQGFANGGLTPQQYFQGAGAYGAKLPTVPGVKFKSVSDYNNFFGGS